MTLQEPIAYGRTADIHAWEDGWILKLFHDWLRSGYATDEVRNTRALHAAGFPVPAVGSVVEVNGRQGFVMERIEGPTMDAEILARPWKLVPSAYRLAELHAQIHATDLRLELPWLELPRLELPRQKLPRQRQWLKAKIQQAEALPDRLRAAALEALARMSDGDRLCHGDFHFANVLSTPRGQVIIDWPDASLGNPWADVARSSVILRGAAVTPSLPWLDRVMAGLCERFYRRRDRSLRPAGAGNYPVWYAINAAVRLSEGFEEIQDWLLGQARAGFE